MVSKSVVVQSKTGSLEFSLQAAGIRRRQGKLKLEV